MVHFSLERLGPSRHDNADVLTPQCESNEGEAVINHPDRDITIFAVILPTILSLNNKRVVENPPCGLEVDAVAGKIVGLLSSSHSNSLLSMILRLSRILQ